MLKSSTFEFSNNPEISVTLSVFKDIKIYKKSFNFALIFILDNCKLFSFDVIYRESSAILRNTQVKILIPAHTRHLAYYKIDVLSPFPCIQFSRFLYLKRRQEGNWLHSRKNGAVNKEMIT